MNNSMRALVTGGSGFIGTHLVDRLCAEGAAVLNIDVAPPKKPDHAALWRNIDATDADALTEAAEAFEPTVVFHLAARTDTLSDDPADYSVNVESARAVLATIGRVGTVERLVFVSTQFVHQRPDGTHPDHDQHFAPHTAYGVSKVEAEKKLREASDALPCAWVIARPTNIWGAWHPRYPNEFWAMLRRGLYVHPSGAPVMRAYGYVGNVVDQLVAMAAEPAERVAGRVFYVGDREIDVRDWAEAFSLRIDGRPIRTVPRAALYGIALLGDVIGWLGGRFPLTVSRYRSMTTANPAPMEKTFATFGEPRLSLEAGVEETVAWLEATDPQLWRRS